MLINFDEERMKEVFDEQIILIIKQNMDIVEKNFKLMYELGFEDVIGLFERCPDFFLNFPNVFEEKLKQLEEELGEEYINLIENDVSLIEEL